MSRRPGARSPVGAPSNISFREPTSQDCQVRYSIYTRPTSSSRPRITSGLRCRTTPKGIVAAGQSLRCLLTLGRPGAQDFINPCHLRKDSLIEAVALSPTKDTPLPRRNRALSHLNELSTRALPPTSELPTRFKPCRQSPVVDEAPCHPGKDSLIEAVTLSPTKETPLPRRNRALSHLSELSTRALPPTSELPTRFKPCRQSPVVDEAPCHQSPVVDEADPFSPRQMV